MELEPLPSILAMCSENVHEIDNTPL